MYAQITNLSIPMNKMDEVRQLIGNKYFNSLKGRSGFIVAYLHEAIDDPTVFQILTYWTDQSMIEGARKTGSLQETIQMLTSHIPSIRITRQGYLVTMNTDDQANAD